MMELNCWKWFVWQQRCPWLPISNNFFSGKTLPLRFKGFQKAPSRPWLPINFYFRSFFLNLFSLNGLSELSNILGSFSSHQKESIALFFVIFEDIPMGLAYFWGPKNLIWKFMREQLSKMWWIWHHWIHLINPHRLRLFSKNLVKFDIFCRLCLSATVHF